MCMHVHMHGSYTHVSTHTSVAMSVCLPTCDSLCLCIMCKCMLNRAIFVTTFLAYFTGVMRSRFIPVVAGGGRISFLFEAE